jgi:hypothetical protein
MASRVFRNTRAEDMRREQYILSISDINFASRPGQAEKIRPHPPNESQPEMAPTTSFPSDYVSSTVRSADRNATLPHGKVDDSKSQVEITSPNPAFVAGKL